MATWPPSPIVEDEATSLAKEYGIETDAARLAEDQPAQSRGSMDQLPVILDTENNTENVSERTASVVPNALNSKRAQQLSTATDVQTETGLPTPPPSDNENRGRARPSDLRKISDEPPSSRSKSTMTRGLSTNTRPSISRIATDINGELQRMKSGSRRAPSPYSYTPEAGTFRVDHPRHADDSLLSPHRVTQSPQSIQKPCWDHERHKLQQHYYESSSDSGAGSKSKKSLRFAEKHQGPTRYSTLSDDHHIDSRQHTEDHKHYTQRQPRGESQTFVKQGSTTNDSRKTASSQRKISRSRSRPRPIRDSPEPAYYSSTDEAPGNGQSRSTRKAGSDGHSVRRRLSHRHEASRLEMPLLQQSHMQGKPSSSDDDSRRRVYRVREDRNSMTPPFATPRQAEDYFSNAFPHNALQPSRYIPRTSIDEIAVISAPSSPPRTPRSERAIWQDSYGTLSLSPSWTPQHSRPPSLEESQVRELKAHTSLLSQATSTAAAAAQAKRSPPTVSRSTSNAIETTLAGTSHAPSTRPRSRASSPQGERIYPSDTFTYGEQAMPRVTYPPVPQSRYPSTRDGPPQVESTHVHSSIQPQRDASWTGYDHQYLANIGVPLHSIGAVNAMPPALHLRVAPQMQRSQSASTPEELAHKLKSFSLPQCPRAQPIQGLRDWLTIKDMPDFRVCPTCAYAISSTRYRLLLVRNPDDRYDKATACAFSRTWIRVAFCQSVRLNKPDLTIVGKINTLLAHTRPCEGSRPSVRMWRKLIDPSTGMAVPGFFACEACVSLMFLVFPELPDQFERDVLHQEKVCGLHQGSRSFNAMMEQLDQISEKCRYRGKSSVRYLQPFVDHIRRTTRYPECAEDKLLVNRPWHYMADLPDFTICEACYDEVVRPQRDKPRARDISQTTKIVPQSAFRGLTTSNGLGTQPLSCQLYSERMRRLFYDFILNKISFETFETKVKERCAAQHRLTEINKYYEADQRIGLDRRADVEKNKLYWRSLE